MLMDVSREITLVVLRNKVPKFITVENVLNDIKL